MNDLRLVVFDVDGTLCDSQDLILAAMRQAFEAEGLPVPERRAVLGIVGLSLPEAMMRLAPRLSVEVQARLVVRYKTGYMTERTGRLAPLYDGIRPLIESLSAEPDILLGIATGKSRRGLTHLLQAHALEGAFFTRQVADDHPSKPHPSMLFAAMAETGVAPERTVMIGDTTYDVEMGQAAAIATLGVGWGYHPAETLAAIGADRVVHRADEVPQALDEIWGRA